MVEDQEKGEREWNDQKFLIFLKVIYPSSYMVRLNIIWGSFIANIAAKGNIILKLKMKWQFFPWCTQTHTNTLDSQFTPYLNIWKDFVAVMTITHIVFSKGHSSVIHTRALTSEERPIKTEMGTNILNWTKFWVIGVYTIKISYKNIEFIFPNGGVNLWEVHAQFVWILLCWSHFDVFSFRFSRFFGELVKCRRIRYITLSYFLFVWFWIL